MEKQNYTRVGTPVRFIEKNGINAGQISRVTGGEVDIWVFPNTGESPILLRNVRHADFKKEGVGYWEFIPQEHSPVDGIQTEYIDN